MDSVSHERILKRLTQTLRTITTVPFPKEQLPSAVTSIGKKGIINVGFIGAGSISIYHAQAVKECKQARLIGIWNRVPEPLGFDPVQRAKEYGCKLYPTAESLVEDPEIHVVYILTNLETHLKYGKLAMNAGKHVLIEKPVGCSVSEVKELMEVAKRNGVKCVPGHNYIYEDPLLRTKQLIESKRIGNLVSLYVMYNIYHPNSVRSTLPGVIRQLLTHHAYVTLYLMGEPVEVTAMKTTIEDDEKIQVPQENLVMLTMRMKNGSLAHIQASFANDDHSSDPWSFYIKVNGTKGAARYSYNDWIQNERGLVHSHTYVAYPDTVKAVSKHFIERVIGENLPPLSTLEDALTCQRIIEACEKSIAERRHVKL